VCGQYAKSIVLTDYLDQLVDNMNYNIQLNTNKDMDIDCDEKTKLRKSRQKDLLSTARGVYLDFSDIDNYDAKTDPIGEPQSIDCIIGSELIYSPVVEHMVNLCKVLKHYLKPNGVYYSIQSDDREGMPEFCELMKENGFTVEAHPPTDDLLGNYCTTQRPETYKFYTMYYSELEECPHPIMK
jgi:predicted nicotinamide N-methyase